VLAGVKEAIARGAIGFDAVKHLVLCRIERRPPAAGRRRAGPSAETYHPAERAARRGQGSFAVARFVLVLVILVTASEFPMRDQLLGRGDEISLAVKQRLGRSVGQLGFGQMAALVVNAPASSPLPAVILDSTARRAMLDRDNAASDLRADTAYRSAAGPAPARAPRSRPAIPCIGARRPPAPCRSTAQWDRWRLLRPLRGSVGLAEDAPILGSRFIGGRRRAWQLTAAIEETSLRLSWNQISQRP
jgi:hypothetical protein